MLTREFWMSRSSSKAMWVVFVAFVVVGGNVGQGASVAAKLYIGLALATLFLPIAYAEYKISSRKNIHKERGASV